MKGLVQIAGIIDLEEARMVARAGVRELGFPLRLAVHREDLSEDEAARIVRAMGAGASFVLITYLEEAEAVLALSRALGVGKVQLHSGIGLDELRRLRGLDPALVIYKSLVVRGGNLGELEADVLRFSPFVDAFITDTFDPVTSACGATGKTHDWEVSRRLVLASPRPVILAGGLNPGNVGRAILYARPAGVDAHTGVEGPDGRKSEELVRAFVSEAARAFSLL
jgi:phosphoribosylanthranilate isomerase